jgi:hypothetical protein
MARRKAAAARQNAAQTGRKFSVSGPDDDDQHGAGGGVVITSKLDTTPPSSTGVKGKGDRMDEGTDYNAEEPADDAFSKAKQGKKHSGLTLIKKTIKFSSYIRKFRMPRAVAKSCD